MRVIYLNYWHPDTHQTSTNRSAAMVKALKEANFEVNLFNHKNSFKIYEGSVRNRLRDRLTGNLDKLLVRWIYLLYITVFKRRERLQASDFTTKEGQSLGDIVLGKEDVLITSGPPSELYGLGYQLATSSPCKWIIDYRDPWTYGYKFPPYHYWLYQPRRWYYRFLENKYLQRANGVIAVHPLLKAYYPVRFQSKIRVIENGSNVSAETLASINPNPKEFHIVYAGSVFNEQLKDKTFFNALQAFLSKHPEAAGKLKVLFIGSGTNPALQVLIDRYGLIKHCEVSKPMATNAALAIMAEARLFLHLRYGKIDAIISSKMYDYLAMQKPILLPSSDDGAIAASIQKHQAGYVCGSVAENIQALEKEWDNYQQGSPCLCKRSDAELNSLDRQMQAHGIVDFIKSL